MNRDDQKTADLLRFEGVMCKGYGTIPKVFMTDCEILITTKAIYLYDRSLAGRGDTSYPGRDRILHDLQISKDAYYKGYHVLTGDGFVHVTQERSNGQFMRNIYTIVSHPTKYHNPPANRPDLAATYQKICQDGLDSLGYGIIPYAVMIDTRLRYQEKVLYGYLAVHCGPDNSTILDPTIIAHHLGISKPHTLQRYIKNLKNLNYLTVTRLYEKGRLTSKCRYTLVQNPSSVSASVKQNATILNAAKQDTALLNAAKQDTVILNAEIQDAALLNAEIQDTALLNAEKQDAEKQDAEKQDTEKQDAEKQDTIITSSTSTSLTNTCSNITSVLMDRLIARVHRMIDYEIMCFAYGGSEIELAALDTLVLAVAETLASPAPRINVGGEPLFADHVRDVLLTLNNTAACNVLERFLVRIDKISPEKHKNYLLTSIYRELLSPHRNDGWDDDLLDAGRA